MINEISIGLRECNMNQILEMKEDESIHGPAPIERTQRDFPNNIEISIFMNKNKGK